MANVGDIVTRLVLDYSNYQAGSRAAIAQNQVFTQSANQLRDRLDMLQKSANDAMKFREGTQLFTFAKQIARTEAAAQTQGAAANNRLADSLVSDQVVQRERLALATENLRSQEIALRTENQTLGQTLGDTTSKELALAIAVEKSNRDMLNAVSATQQMTAASANAEIRQNSLASSIERERQAALSAVNSMRLLTDQQGSLAFQTARTEAVTNQLMLAIKQDRQATLEAARAKEILRAAMQSGEITAQEYKRAIANVNSANTAMNAGLGRTQLAISQAIFAVDDAATVYGTMGLAGAVRAASNNLTMMAGLLGGPWALGIAVAISAATQLTLAFSGMEESAKKAKKAAEDYQNALKGLRQYRVELAGRKETFGSALSDMSNADSPLQGAKAASDEIKRRQERQSQIEAARKERIRQMEDLHSQQRQWEGVNRSWSQWVDTVPMRFMGQGALSNTLQNPVMADLYALDTRMAQKAEDLKNIESERKRIGDEQVDAERERIRIQEEMIALDEERARLLEIDAEMRRVNTQADRDNSKLEGAKKVKQDWLDLFYAINQAADAQTSFWQGQRKMEADRLASQQLDIERQLRFSKDKTGREEQRYRIAREHMERERMIDEAIATAREKQAMRIQNEKMSVRELMKLDAVPVQGPSGFGKDSKEFFDLQRQSILSVMRPKPKEEQYQKKLADKTAEIATESKKHTTLFQSFMNNLPRVGSIN